MFGRKKQDDARCCCKVKNRKMCDYSFVRGGKKMRVDLQVLIHFSLNPALGCHCVTMLNLNVEKQMCNELFCELQVRPTTVLFRAFVSSVTEF